MKTARKVLMLILCAALLVSATVMGTLAYLTADDAVTNTFSVGNIKMVLDEQDTDDSKTNVTTEGRDRANAYKLMPGKDYKKDPTVWVAEGSEKCYLFVTVANGIAAIEAETNSKKNDGTVYTDIADQMTNNGWVALNAEKYPNVYVLKNNGVDVTDNAGKNYKVFKEFMIDGNKVVNVAENETTPQDKLNIADYADATIVINAYAVQLDGFDSAAEAWAATFGAPQA